MNSSVKDISRSFRKSRHVPGDVAADAVATAYEMGRAHAFAEVGERAAADSRIAMEAVTSIIPALRGSLPKN